MAERAAQRRSTTEVPRVYVASLADYNSGRLHGVWVEASDADAAYEAVADMLKASRELVAEDVAIHDHENFGSYSPREFESLDTVCAIGAALEELGPAFADFLGHVGPPRDADDVAGMVARFQEAYQGEWDSLADWAESFLEDTGTLADVPASLRQYIDFERWADDAEMNGDVFTSELGAKVHVFWAR